MSRVLPPAPTWTFGPVTRTDIVRYQGASGDFNPIHHDDGFAQAAGYPGAFSAGMFQAGLLASYASTWLGAKNLRTYRVRFREQVWPGDTLHFSGSITQLGDDPDAIRALVALECRRQTGAPAVTATARFEISTHPRAGDLQPTSENG